MRNMMNVNLFYYLLRWHSSLLMYHCHDVSHYVNKLKAKLITLPLSQQQKQIIHRLAMLTLLSSLFIFYSCELI